MIFSLEILLKGWGKNPLFFIVEQCARNKITNNAKILSRNN